MHTASSNGENPKNFCKYKFKRFLFCIYMYFKISILETSTTLNEPTLDWKFELHNDDDDNAVFFCCIGAPKRWMAKDAPGQNKKCRI